MGRFSPAHRAALIRLLCTATVIGFLIGAGGQSLRAQDVAVGSATATVLTVLTVSADAALDFGNVYQGVPKSVANNDASAAIFSISGAGESAVFIYLQLPEYLSLSDNSDRMTISFGSTDCSVDSTGQGDPSLMNASRGWQNVNPYAIPSGTAVGGGGTTNLYLGGRITPSAGQKAGSYSADIVLTVAYEGT